MLRILSELLNMAQVESGRIQLHSSLVNPANLADNVISAVHNLAMEKNVTINKSYPVDFPALYADGEKTEWVLSNFLNNAIRYSPDGSAIKVGITVSINDIRFSVSDYGTGIPA